MTKSELNKRYAELMGWEEIQGALKWDGRSRINFDPLGHGTVWRCPDGPLCNEPPDWTEPNRFFGEVVPEVQRVCGYTFQHKLEIYFDYVGSTVHCGIFRPDANFGKKLLAEESGKSEGEAGLHAAIKALEAINGKS